MGLLDKAREWAAGMGRYSGKEDYPAYDENADIDVDNFENEDYNYEYDYDNPEYAAPRKGAKDKAAYGDRTTYKNYKPEPKETPYVSSYGKPRVISNEKSKIYSISANVQMQVVIAYPESYDEASTICDYLKSHRTVVVNLESVQRETAQRIVDVLSGVICALNGEMQYISNKIFILAPENVDISGDFKEELKANGLIFTLR